MFTQENSEYLSTAAVLHLWNATPLGVGYQISSISDSYFAIYITREITVMKY